MLEGIMFIDHAEGLVGGKLEMLGRRGELNHPVPGDGQKSVV